jgi:hypothetical protein
VARTLERAWEDALAEHARLKAEHEAVTRERPLAPSVEELAAIRTLAHDLPAVWRAETTTQEERQTIIRLLVERILVEVVGDTEQVRVECHWQGGSRTQHQIVRPVSSAKRLSTYAALIDWASELQRAGRGGGEIAAILNREGRRPAKRCDAFTGSMARHLLRTAKPRAPLVSRARHLVPAREPDEWTIAELASRLGRPCSTIYSWIRRGRLQSRSTPVASRPIRLVRADAATIAASPISTDALLPTPEA